MSEPEEIAKRKGEINHRIARILKELSILTDEYAREPNEMLAIVEAEEAMHKVLQTFEQEIKEYP